MYKGISLEEIIKIFNRLKEEEVRLNCICLGVFYVIYYICERISMILFCFNEDISVLSL